MTGIFEFTSKNTDSYIKEMLNAVIIETKIERCSKELIRRKKAVKLIVDIQIQSDTFLFFVDSNSPKHKLSYDNNAKINNVQKGTLRNLFGENKKMSSLLHPFLNLCLLGEHLLNGLTGIHLNWFATFLRDWSNVSIIQPRIKIELIGRVTCRGKLSLGIEQFIIYSNQNIPRSRKEEIVLEKISTNRTMDHVFSYLEVKFKNNKNITGTTGSTGTTGTQIIVVKVLGIVRLTNLITHEESIKLVVLRMVPKIFTPKSFLEQSEDVIIKYSYSKSQDGRMGGMDIDVVDLEAVVRPSCAIQVFTNSFPPNHKETYAERINGTAKSREFSLVTIHKFHAFKISNWDVNGDSQLSRNTNNNSSSSNVVVSETGTLNLYPSVQEMQYINDQLSSLRNNNYDSDESEDDEVLEYDAVAP